MSLKFCVECGAPAEGLAFCGKCGAKILDRQPSASNPAVGQAPASSQRSPLYAAKREVSLKDAIKGFYLNYTVFAGRANLAEFWKAYLANVLVGLGLYLVLAAVTAGLMSADSSGSNGAIAIPAIIFALYSLANLVPNLAITVRRLHDTGRSGGWIFISFVPIVGSIILLVFLCAQSQRGPNYYGDE